MKYERCERTYWKNGKEYRCRRKARQEFGYDVVATISLDGKDHQDNDERPKSHYEKLCDRHYNMEVYMLNKEGP